MEKHGLTIALLEDDADQAGQALAWLQAAGHTALWGSNRTDFLALVRAGGVDVLVMDWQLPDCEGIDVLKEVRVGLQYEGPVLFATARNTEEDIVRGLEQGADDYLVKPLRRAEFLARLMAVVRRGRVPEKVPDELRLGNLVIDLGNKRVELSGEEIILTPTEYRLAECLCSNVEVLLSREYLLDAVWNVKAELDTRTVDLHMSRLRKKLNIGPAMGYNLRTVYRHGYRLEKISQ